MSDQDGSAVAEPPKPTGSDRGRGRANSRTNPERQAKHARAIELRQRGLSGREIGRAIGIPSRSVYTFLERNSVKKQATQRYITERADILASLQALSHDVQAGVIQELRKKLVSGALTDWQLIELVQKLSLSANVAYQAERLERGESTANVSVHTSIVQSIHEARRAQSQGVPATGAPVVAEAAIPTEHVIDKQGESTNE